MREWLIQARMSKGLSLKTMANKLDISESYYSDIEKGERQKRLDISLAKRISEVAGITVDKIIEMER